MIYIVYQEDTIGEVCFQTIRGAFVDYNAAWDFAEAMHGAWVFSMPIEDGRTLPGDVVYALVHNESDSLSFKDVVHSIYRSCDVAHTTCEAQAPSMFVQMMQVV